MTTAPSRPGSSAGAPDATRMAAPRAAADVDAPLSDPCLDPLLAAIEAGRALGIDVATSQEVAVDARARLGFPTDRPVVALVGGTGVGKSSLLNALAGGDVSPASPRRPTTATPVAWLPASAEATLGPVLDWLGVASGDRRVEHDPAGAGIAILDLPDLDSIEPEHRRRVDALLPRVDAVIWVTDPEKYRDAVLHDEVLARWIPRLGRQLVVINKADRLAGDDADRLRRHLAADIGAFAAHGSDAGSARPPDVVLASAASGSVDAVRTWLDETAATKAVVRSRLIASIRSSVEGLAAAAGVTRDRWEPLLDGERRQAAADDAAAALLRVVDLRELERQATAATRARARGRGAGPLGGLTSRIFRWSGREARVADPAGYLARWHERGTAATAAGSVRAALAGPLRSAPAPIRRALAEDSTAPSLEAALGRAVDRAIARDPGEPPTSRWWTVIGLAQTVTTGALVLSVAWLILWVLIRFPVDEATLPVIGRVPIPFVALAAVLAAGYLIARLLGAHAGAVGRRWASALARRIREAVRAEVAATAFDGLDRIEARRADLAAALSAARRDCR